MIIGYSMTTQYAWRRKALRSKVGGVFVVRL
jgi:hypothetical protein